MRVFFLSFIVLFASCLNAMDVNKSDINEELNKTTLVVDKKKTIPPEIVEAENKLKALESSVKDNIWLIQYSNHQKYNNLKKEYDDTRAAYRREKNEEKKSNLDKKLKTISEQIDLLKDYSAAPFTKILEVKNLGEQERIANPIEILSGISDIKNLLNQKSEYRNNLNSLSMLIAKFEEKKNLLNLLLSDDPDNEDLKNKIETLNLKMNEFLSVQEIGKTTFDVYSKRIDERINSIRLDITEQIKRAINIIALIIFVILLSILFKYIAKKSIKDDDRIYTTNKVINFLNVTLIIIIVFLAYIENVTYFVTVLGFASAGIAIAMKDMFMSMLGWLVITVGGSFHVGDRIRVKKLSGELYVGDIIDISILRMTIYEDVTYTTYTESRRAGRIIFIPNNYIFTELIANYTHYGMKTVWDGIDILLTFDSNHQKATHLIQNIARKYSKGYTEMAKKSMNKLRRQYSIKNSSMEPRIFQFFEPYGIKISVWYMTNSYASLNLRSNISGEILDAIRNEDDITIAYPTQTLYLRDKNSNINQTLETQEIKNEEKTQIKEENS
ncbi:mechanosensitive ion channel family protein [Campylobacter blaseri]|uniref:Mechanosensitive ion channel MscS domain-containing protein n=1 Tax=Campylobacter blaseri TaxID=2042961 RepID=A0A2P8R2C3_9BACT|nr:mechanosensitive ion channel domain-containing protein [Campylobacter blaseri]PSM52656.1 hypothetical protein CQ405_02685 [Campylobacter blaseri]PSM54304.1 hypothetical protein CRN67_02685 [Campylobacter blaseri]QKF85955.1 mechanosensitive ion channel family protein [Campylobacter blaseri]